MRICYFANGNLAEIPANSDGGRVIAKLVASGAAQYLECDGSFRGHVDARHCCLTMENQITLLPESDWPENQALEGGDA